MAGYALMSSIFALAASLPRIPKTLEGRKPAAAEQRGAGALGERLGYGDPPAN